MNELLYTLQELSLTFYNKRGISRFQIKRDNCFSALENNDA